jgi:hypothetical protein
MNIALIIGKENSTEVPGKNIREFLGRPSAEYAYIAAKYAGCDKIYVSTDSITIANIGKNYGAIHIDRPADLATSEALTEDVLTHAYDFIKDDAISEEIKTISLLFCNNPAVDVELLKSAIGFLEVTDEFDSCFSVAKYDMFAPVRARKIGKDGEILNAVDLDSLDNISSIRGAQGSTYFCDLSIQVMKPVCIEQMDDGALPFKWQGRKSKAIETDFGFDVDSEWQAVVVEYWLKKHGYTDNDIPWSIKSMK